MPLSPDGRKNLGYTRHSEDRDHTCFYCQTTLDKDYFDYVPPRDVMKDSELRALVDVPFMYVTSCHNCKTRVYPKRYMLKTPESRRDLINGKKRRSEIDEIKRQLTMQPLEPWQGYSTDAFGKQSVIDIDESLLDDETLAAKYAARAAQIGEEDDPGQQKAQSQPNSGAQDAPGDVLSAKPFDLGF